MIWNYENESIIEKDEKIEKLNIDLELKNKSIKDLKKIVNNYIFLVDEKNDIQYDLEIELYAINKENIKLLNEIFSLKNNIMNLYEQINIKDKKYEDTINNLKECINEIYNISNELKKYKLIEKINLKDRIIYNYL